jgi:hypothetical protein
MQLKRGLSIDPSVALVVVIDRAALCAYSHSFSVCFRCLLEREGPRTFVTSREGARHVAATFIS